MNKDYALYCSRLILELTSIWFVRYISSYFHKIEWYKTEAIDWFWDWWIDIKWYKKIWNAIKNIIIQCKKRFYDYIRPGEILTFIYNIKKGWYKNHTLYFATTTQITKESKKIAQENNIKVIDCKELLKIRKKYSLDDFEKDFWKYDYKQQTYKYKFFTKNNVNSIINENYRKDIETKSITRYNLLENNMFHKNHYGKIIKIAY